ncbi:MAG: DUF3422 domain-containing protein [Rhodospirillales bacterium]|nr:DUF3422 domain-containing protein [Rhodospirillales bacterium]
MSGSVDHPLRQSLTNEVHARPFAALVAPERISHFAMLSGEGTAATDRTHLDELCQRFGVAPPPAEVNHAFVDFGAFRLKWERHTEFCAWTVFVHGGFTEPFVGGAVDRLPADWVENLPGRRLVAAHVAIAPPGEAASPGERLARYFEPAYLAGSRVAGGMAEVWTDFRIHPDGFGRILVQDRGLAERQAGRLAQRLLEIETYRMMALLALPVAREIGPRISTVDRELAAITGTMRDMGGLDDERRLLDRLIGLAAEIESVTAGSDYRFGAARAYSALVERRIAELREERIVGLQTIGEFMERRLAPAMRTCAAIADRLATMAARLSRASALLSTRVEIAHEAQNQELLASMDRRARLQLRLQATVEGLSVAAISYYVVGLIGYVLRTVETVGVAVDHELATGVAIPPVVAAVWFGVRRVRRRISKEGGAAGRR